MKLVTNINTRIESYKALDSKDKKTYWKELLLNNAMYILLIIAILYTFSQNPKFLAPRSIVNIISLSAANLPIACGIAGCIVLTGTDLSAGRVVGLTACISASLLAGGRLCKQDVPEYSAAANSGCYFNRIISRRDCRMGKRFLRSKIPAASIYCNPGNPADCIWYSAGLHYGQWK